MFLACCKNNLRQIDADNIFKKESAAETISIEFHENAVFNYSDVFDNISFIKLETNEHCLIGKISKLIALDKYFIIMDINNDNIFVFNESGRFINQIGSKGQGGSEYIHTDDIVYDKYIDAVLILDRDGKKILRYKIDGSFIDNIKLNWWISAIEVIDHDKYLLYIPNTVQPDSKQLDYYFYVVNSKGQITDQLLSNAKTIQFSYAAENSLSSYGDKVIFSPFRSSNIYEINSNSITPKYYLDFGDYNMPYVYFNSTDRKEVSKVSRNYAINLRSWEMNNWLVNKISYKQELYYNFYLKSKKKNITTAYLFNDVKYHINGEHFVCNKGDDILVGYFEANSFYQFNQIMVRNSHGNIKKCYLEYIMNEELKDDLKSNLMSVIERSEMTLSYSELDYIADVKEDDNPILCLFTLKKE